MDINELLKEAKRRYPKGTKFKSALRPDNGEHYIVEQELQWYSSTDITEGPTGASVYHNGKWAEIVQSPIKIHELWT